MSPTRAFTLDHRPELGRTLSALRAGRGDRTARIDLSGVWKATRTPAGPGTIHLRARGTTVEAEAWGPGADWLLERAPAWAGADDEVDGFDPTVHAVVAGAAHARPGLRVPRTERVLDVLVPTILAQKVTGIEARRSWSALVRHHAEPAPGPAGLSLPPDPADLARLPDHVFHRANVEARRAATIRAACRDAAALEAAATAGPAPLAARLGAIRGIGPWTIAEVTFTATGAADAVSVGDYHLPNTVAWHLAGEPRADDARMLELLAPFAGHRGRVARLLEGLGGAPRRGPRLDARSIAAI